MHSVSVLALDRVLAFDLSTPLEVFGRARLPDGRVAYTVSVCAPCDEVDAGAFGLRTTNGLDALAGADTIIVPGLADPTAPVSDDVLEALRAAAEGGTRIASICVGAFTLAAAGLLNGLRATTHWAAAKELSRRRPLRRQRWDPHLRRRRGGLGPLSVHDPPGSRFRGGGRCRQAGRNAPRARRWAGPVHRARATRRRRLQPPTALALDRRERPSGTHPRRPRYQGKDEYPHPEPAFPRADVCDPDAVAAKSPDPAVPVSARDHGTLRRADRPPGRFQLSDELPRTLQEVGRHQPASLPARFPGFTSLLTEVVERRNP